MKCLVSAYESHDVEALEVLLASDYQYVFGDNEAIVDRSKEIEVSRKLFSDASVHSVGLDLVPTSELVTGTEANTWKLPVAVNLHIDKMVDGQVEAYDSKAICEIWIRLEKDVEPHYVIYRWLEQKAK
jgi:hypothetical protein